MEESVPAPTVIMDRVRQWKDVGESVVKGLVDCFSDIESREENLRSVLADLNEKERALRLREDELRLGKEELDGKQRLVDVHIVELEVSRGEVDALRVKEAEGLKEIEERGRELEKRSGELVKRLGDFERREKEYDAFCDGKLRELASKEEVFRKEKAKLVEKLRLASEKLEEKQKLEHGFIQKLEMTVETLSGVKVVMDDKFKEIESREEEAHASLTTRLNEADLIGESLEKRFKELEGFEKELNLSQEDRPKEMESEEGKETKQQTSELQNKPEEKKQELGLIACKKENDSKEQRSMEKSLSCVRESAQTCAEENLALSELVADKGVHFEEQGLKQPIVIDTTDACLTAKQDESVDSKHALHKKVLVTIISCNGEDLELMNPNIHRVLSLSSDPAKLVLEALEGIDDTSLGILDKDRRATIILLDLLTKLSPKICDSVIHAAIKLALTLLRKLKTSISVESSTEALAFLHLLTAYGISDFFDRNELFSFLKLADKHKHTPDLCRTFGFTEKIPDYIKELIDEKRFLLASTYIHEYQLQKMFPQAAVLNSYATHFKLAAKAQCKKGHNTSAAKDKGKETEIAALSLAIEHIVKYGLESDYSPKALTARIKQLEAPQAGSKSRKGNPPAPSKIKKEGVCYGPQQLSKKARRKRRREAEKAAADQKTAAETSAAEKTAASPLNPQMAPSPGSNNGPSPVCIQPPQAEKSAAGPLNPQMAPCRGSNNGPSTVCRQPTQAKKSSAGPPNPQMAPCRRSNNRPSPGYRQPPQHQSINPRIYPAVPVYPWGPVNLVPMPQFPGPPHKRHRANTWGEEGGSHVGQFSNQY
ncbi:FRIGIDA-like protein 3 [Salvia hispanica]|uniref:FRIGIDA-like protein 3 n=1 Tax=Salvia hispanica TaxID=49212 RepID=UPI0020095422|nr:FRIGIDA-like protein 3 [Salvia hispanica]XP_047976224.1 FRIGIDA-like protein 3 [Salvia hispanica]